MKKFISLLLAAVLCVTVFAGCSETTNKIASSVAEAARKELEVQVKAALEENKLEVIEIKTAFGKLNDTADNQYFIAALVRTEKTDLIEASLKGLDMVFTDTGCIPETDSKIDCEHLIHKDLSYQREDFTDGTYFTVYAYYDDITKFVPKNG
jgi:outer membrane murein-binding lipoprotein Lpp